MPPLISLDVCSFQTAPLMRQNNFNKPRRISLNIFLKFITVLSKLLTSLGEADNKLSGEKELHFLQTLLQSKEINALVNVHHKVAKVGKGKHPY